MVSRDLEMPGNGSGQIGGADARGTMQDWEELSMPCGNTWIGKSLHGKSNSYNIMVTTVQGVIQIFSIIIASLNK